MVQLKIGDRIIWKNYPGTNGTIRWIGKENIDLIAGIEFDSDNVPIYDNFNKNEDVEKRFFCKKGFGRLVPLNQLMLLKDFGPNKPKKLANIEKELYSKIKIKPELPPKSPKMISKERNSTNISPSVVKKDDPIPNVQNNSINAEGKKNEEIKDKKTNLVVDLDIKKLEKFEKLVSDFSDTVSNSNSSSNDNSIKEEETNKPEKAKITDLSWVKLNKLITWKKENGPRIYGYVRWKGIINEELTLGIEMDKASDEYSDGKGYFECKEKHGFFVTINDIIKDPSFNLHLPSTKPNSSEDSFSINKTNTDIGNKNNASTIGTSVSSSSSNIPPPPVPLSQISKNEIEEAYYNKRKEQSENINTFENSKDKSETTQQMSLLDLGVKLNISNPKPIMEISPNKSQFFKHNDDIAVSNNLLEHVQKLKAFAFEKGTQENPKLNENLNDASNKNSQNSNLINIDDNKIDSTTDNAIEKVDDEIFVTIIEDDKVIPKINYDTKPKRQISTHSVVFNLDGVNLTLGSICWKKIVPEEFGLIKWVGEIDDKMMAGIQFFSPIGNNSGYLDDIFLFKTEPKCGQLISIDKLKEKEEFQILTFEEYQNLKREIFIPINISALQASEEKRGIQGEKNSCYVDSLIFSMFAFTNAFDHLFWGPQPLMTFKDETEKTRNVSLRETLLKIVNSLRIDNFVSSSKVMRLRKIIGELNANVQDAFMDVEEIMILLFDRIYHLDNFINYNSGVSDYFHQIILEDNHNISNITNVQTIFELSMLDLMTKMKNAPVPGLILMIPRSHGQLKSGKIILPNLSLNFDHLINGTKLNCIICGDLATMECSLCYNTIQHSGINSTVFCKNCEASMHKHPQRKSHRRKVRSLPPPNDEGNLSSKTFYLHSIICIRDHHYTTFVKCGTGKLSHWCFFNSDPGGGKPIIEIQNHFGESLEEVCNNVEKINENFDKIPSRLQHLLTDSYVYIYI